jgi:hypothetical protein
VWLPGVSTLVNKDIIHQTNTAFVLKKSLDSVESATQNAHSKPFRFTSPLTGPFNGGVHN